jgi:S-formylglutathione hydrolase FrmB
MKHLLPTRDRRDAPAGSPTPRGRRETLQIQSRALEDNPLGDPAGREIAVWLPPSYATDRARRFPVIYVLAGFSSTGAALFQGTPWQPALDLRLDRLVGGGAMGEVIVVAPDGFNRYGGSQYIDSPASGRYETHLCDEVIPAVDAAFRTTATRTGRALAGKSSGGYGALVLGMHRPALFSALASHAGDAYFELSILPDIPKAYRTLRRHGGIDGFLHHFDTAPIRRSEDITTMMMLALGAAYAPDAGAPHGFALPFDQQTGEIVAAVWARFRASDPIELLRLPAHQDALRSMSLVFLDAGNRDEWALDIAARILAERLRGLGVAVEHQEFEDGHMGTAYRYDVSLPKLAAVIGAEPYPGAASPPRTPEPGAAT